MSTDLIARFGRSITVNRAISAGEYVDGIWQEPMRENISVVASVQNLTPKEVLMLPEGDRKRERLKLYSTFEFRTQQEDTLQAADYVMIDGREYMVISIADYVVHNRMNLKYFRADVVSTNPKETA